jgi:hypothetical protein
MPERQQTKIVRMNSLPSACPSGNFQTAHIGVYGSSEVPERKRKETERRATASVMTAGDSIKALVDLHTLR